MKRINLITLLLTMSSVLTFAAPPSWLVNPQSFTFDMTVTAVINENCLELKNPSNRLGAFVGNELRGTVFTSTVVGGRYIALLSVYSNTVSGEKVTFKFYNADTDTEVETKTSFVFQDDAVFGSPSLPVSIVSNNAPSELSLSAVNITENQASGVIVGNLTATDLDLSDVYSFQLVSGQGSEDNSSFALVGNQLTTIASLDFENKSAYNVRVKAQEGSNCSIEKSFSIQVLNINDLPTSLTLSNNFINENSSKSTEIGVLSTQDQDQNQTHTYQLVSGNGDTDNASFAVIGTKLVTNSTLDFETKSTFSIRLKVTDSQGGSFEKEFTISLNDVNDSPTGLTISVNSLDENNKKGAVIGLLTAQDQDAGDAHTYAFKSIPGNNNDQFFIVGNQLKASEVFDFEKNNEYYVYISTFDNSQKEFFTLVTININDANDAPTSIELTNSSVAENLPIGTFVGKLSTEDIDASQSHIYSLVNGSGDSDNNSFIIRNDSILSNAVFQINTKSQFSIRVKTDDQNGATFSKIFTIFIKDANDAPTDIQLDNLIVLETATTGSLVGILTSSDADLGDGHSYSFVSGRADNSAFTITGDKLKTNTTFDFETKSSYSIRIASQDNFGGRVEKDFTVTVSNGNDIPSDIALSSVIVTENKVQGTLVGVFTTTDKDVNDIHTYSLAGTGNDNSFFVISSNKLLSNSKFDFETKSSYFLNIKTDDGKGGTFEKQFTVTVKDSTDAPTAIEITSNEVEEEQTIGKVVGVFSSIDVDVNETFTYSFVSGSGSDHNAKFTLSGDTLKTAEIFDFTTTKVLKIRIKSTDAAGLTTEKAFLINVKDINDAPTNITLSNKNVFENNTLGATIGSFTSTDQDPNETFTYSLVTGTGDMDNAMFIISGNELKSNTVFDFETNDTLKIRVSTTDALGDSFEKSFEIYVKDANDSPTDMSLLSVSVKENKVKGTTITKMTTQDSDISNTHTYSFENVDGNDNNAFLIFGNELKTNTVFDFETKSQYFIALKTTDAFGKTYSKQFTISILDSNDAPLGLNLSKSTINEKEAVGKLIGFFSTVEIDASDSHTYTFVSNEGGEDNTSFTINGNTLSSNGTFDFNIKNEYSILVKTTDANGLSIIKPLKINVLNVNVAPTAIALSGNELVENQKSNTIIGFITTTDEDENEKFAYQLVSGTGGEDNTKFTIKGDTLLSNSVFDSESKSSFNIRLKVTDLFKNTYEQSFTVKIIDANESPVGFDAQMNISEDANIPTVLSSISATDVDKNQTLSYSFIPQSGIENLFSIAPLTGEVSFTKGKLNYEKTPEYKLLVKISDSGSPSLTDTISLTISVIDEVESFLPSADYVSPNGDEKNDTWVVKNVALYEDYSLTIFTANGSIIYSIDSGYDNSWDAKKDGQDLPTGAYYYIFKSNTDPSKIFKGTISVIK